MPALIALLAGLGSLVAPSAGITAAAPPCAGCVTWRAAPDVARSLLAADGRLDGLDVLVTLEAGEPADVALAVMRDLSARGATVSLERPLEAEADLAPLAGIVTRVLLRLPPGAIVDDALVFRVRTSATAARAALPAALVGLTGEAEVLSGLAARDARPYVSVLAATGAAPARRGDAAAFEWWSRAEAGGSVEDVLALTAASVSDRLVVALREPAVPVALRVASLAAVLPPGLTPLATVEVCAAACNVPVFLHPRTLQAVTVTEGGGRLRVRPGATRAYGRSLRDGAEAVLPVTAGSRETEVDARALRGTIVLQLAGWAGGEAGFTAGVEVTAARILTLEEILAAHQAAAARQALAVRTLIATGVHRPHLPGARPGRAHDRHRGDRSLPPGRAG